MPTDITTAVACPNIAFIKYWGNRDSDLRIPANGSLSMNLDGLFTRTQIAFDPDLAEDSLVLNGRKITGKGLLRVSAFLDEVRRLAGSAAFARVASENNFPTAAGIASSASAFAALSLAATAALGLSLPERELSRLARLGSGSACRSVPGGFVEWQAGAGDADSFAFSVAPPEHWEIVDCIAVVSAAHKTVTSTEGHALANTSPLQAGRVADAPRRLDLCRAALLSRDFDALAEIVELDSNLMHAVMMTSRPSLFYWTPATLQVMQSVRDWRARGLPACYTIDAGPNVHVLTAGGTSAQVQRQLCEISGVEQVIVAPPGGPAALEK